MTRHDSQNRVPRGLVWATALLVTAGAAGAQFIDVTIDAGLGDYVGSSGDDHGLGGVFADLDNDGYPDLVLVTGWGQKSFVYRNVAGAGAATRRFVKSELHLTHTYGSTGAVAGDYDNDGDLDVYVTNHPRNSVGFAFAPNQLYKNLWVETGKLTFTNVTASTDPTPAATDDQEGLSHGVCPLSIPGCANSGGVLDNSLTAAWADVDRDGDLDLYVGNHDGWIGSPQEGPKPGQRDVLYRNDGNGTFTDITWQAGTPGFSTETGGCCTPIQDFSSTNAVIFADLNGDGWPDLYVSNKVGPPEDIDMVYLNRGTPLFGGGWIGFENVSYQLAARESPSPMGVDAADYDNDGDLDLYLADIVFPNENRNELLRNTLAETGTLDFEVLQNGDGWSWGAKWLDVDNDGDLEVHVTTQNSPGHEYPDQLFDFPAGVPQGQDIAPGLGLAQVKNARGNLAADYDRDGDLDLLVLSLGERPTLWQNELDAGAPGKHFLELRLTGRVVSKSPRDAIGARVYLTADTGGGQSVQMREVVSGSGNAASTSDLTVHFGLGQATEADLLIRWPSGRVQEMRGVAADQILPVAETTSGDMVIGEVGQVVVDHQPRKVTPRTTVLKPVVFAQPASANGADVSVVRLHGANFQGFDLSIDEAPNHDGPHADETVSYVILAPGRWELADGTLLEVGTLQTSATVGRNVADQWAQVSFQSNFRSLPVVITQVQTDNDPSWVKTRQRSISTGGFQVALEEEESVTAPHGTETIGWLAIEPASGTWSAHPYRAANTPRVVTNAWIPGDFGIHLGAAPRFLASLATYFGPDSAHVRYRDLTPTGADLRVEEDTTQDAETGHTTEVLSVLVLGTDGLLTAKPGG